MIYKSTSLRSKNLLNSFSKKLLTFILDNLGEKIRFVGSSSILSFPHRRLEHAKPSTKAIIQDVKLANLEKSWIFNLGYETIRREK